jgi:proline iminopeptidase
MFILSTLIVLLTVGFAESAASADSLYSRAYGNAKNPAVVFLHGGPGYNAVSFELSSAQRLADSGFYLIVFDQRGCGRSAKLKGKYTLDEACDDILSLYQKYGIARATMIGHSWGGTLGIFFAERYPELVDELILTGSPLSYQRGFKTMLAKSLYYYSTRDSNQFKMVKALERADTSSLIYASMLFQHAGNIGLYKPSIVDSEAAILRERMKQDTISRYMRDLTQAPVIGFYKSLKYTTLDMTDVIKRVVNRTPIRIIYGDEDGLFDQDHLNALSYAAGTPIRIILNASHNAFLDQPTAFMSELTKQLR